MKTFESVLATAKKLFDSFKFFAGPTLFCVHLDSAFSHVYVVKDLTLVLVTT